jgi:hypothetical protein
MGPIHAEIARDRTLRGSASSLNTGRGRPYEGPGGILHPAMAEARVANDSDVDIADGPASTPLFSPCPVRDRPPALRTNTAMDSYPTSGRNRALVFDRKPVKIKFDPFPGVRQKWADRAILHLGSAAQSADLSKFFTPERFPRAARQKNSAPDCPAG